MDLDPIVSFLHGWILLLASFAIALGYAMFKGRQNLINLLMGMYLGLLLYHFLPFQDTLTEQVSGSRNQAFVALAIFIILTFLSTWLFTRLMPREYFESTFETMGKKILLAIAAMVLVMTLSQNYLPISDIMNTGTPLPEFLETNNLAYLWLILPLIAMFLV